MIAITATFAINKVVLRLFVSKLNVINIINYFLQSYNEIENCYTI